MKKREFPQSHLLPVENDGMLQSVLRSRALALKEAADMAARSEGRLPAACDQGARGGALSVRSTTRSSRRAGRADDLYKWLKDNHYTYSGDEATLGFSGQKKWLFTVMKIDTMQMKRNKDGTFAGEVTRRPGLQFASDKLVYPLKITQISVKDKTEALFYVQAPTKVDLKGDFSYQMTWVPMLQAATGCTPGGIQGGGEQWVKTFGPQIPAADGSGT